MPGGFPWNATIGGVPGDKFACRFDTPGTFIVTATVTKADNSIVKHYLMVNVLSVNFSGPVACEAGFRREKDVVIEPAARAADVSFSAKDAALLEVSVKGAAPNGVTLCLKPLTTANPVLVARLGGATGPIFSAQTVDVFTTEFPTIAYMLMDQDSRTCKPNLLIKPRIGALDVHFVMFAHTCTFDGGATTLSTNTTSWEAYTPPNTSEVDGLFKYSIEIPENENSSCYTVKFFQSGVPISFSH